MNKEGQGGGEEVICRYCGDAIDLPLVICVDCRTPHHEDCFRENGLCTIYACGCPTFGRVDTTESFVNTLALPAHCSVENNLQTVTLGETFHRPRQSWGNALPSSRWWCRLPPLRFRPPFYSAAPPNETRPHRLHHCFFCSSLPVLSTSNHSG